MSGIDDRPRWNGVPVPYVARWSSEIRDTKVNVSRHGEMTIVRYADEHPHERDRAGVLWMREGLSPGKGEPQFAQIHTHRQRRCMFHYRCQVCSTKLDKTASVPWIIPKAGSDLTMNRQPFLTWHAPLCEPCSKSVPLLCPSMVREGGWLLSVSKSDVWGVFGDIAYYDQNNQLVHTQTRQMYTSPMPVASMMIARQVIRVVEQFLIVKEW